MRCVPFRRLLRLRGKQRPDLCPQLLDVHVQQGNIPPLLLLKRAITTPEEFLDRFDLWWEVHVGIRLRQYMYR